MKIRFKRFVFLQGYVWNGEGEAIAETDSAYKVKTGWWSDEWVLKSNAEIITEYLPSVNKEI